MVVKPLDSGFLRSDDPTVPKTSTSSGDATVSFRTLIPRPDHPRIAGISKHTARTWCDSRREVPAPAWLIDRLDLKNLEEYTGFSDDGKPEVKIRYEEDEGAPVEESVRAVEELLSALSAEEKKEVLRGSVEGDEFRAWSNPELYVNPGGIRLDETTPEIQTLIHNILKASLSSAGYKKAYGCMLTNDFLGHLVNGKSVLNEHSFNFRLFLPESGKPSLTEPWGYTFFGHHLCLAVMFCGKRMVIGPTFMGAEPDEIDEGPHKGLRLFLKEESWSLGLMRSLSEENRKRAQVNEGMDLAGGLKEDRWNPFDERHLGGARQDNRVVPFEGCPISLFTDQEKEQVYKLIEEFNIYLPEQPLKHKMRRIREYEDQTYFAWIGKYGLEDPYYFRIHSPVTFCEFDFHCGIFLTNTSPAKCHIHTINRLPNLEDYGKALIQQYGEEKGQ